jgi:hypothetical protein
MPLYPHTARGVSVAAREQWYDLAFRTGYELDDLGEMALEDYARVLGRAQTAEAVRGADERVSGVRLRDASEPPSAAACRDIEDFARDLAGRGGGSGLGWA